MSAIHVGRRGMPVLLSALLLAAAPAPGQTRVNPDAKAIADFVAKVNDYVALHRKLEATLPKVPTDASSEQIDASQHALARLLQQARPEAKQGDLFIKPVRGVLRRQLLRVFSGPDAKALKDAVMEDNAGPIKVQVNGRYPDEIPLATVPPKVLEALPELPPELEYRFLGNRLLLLDEHAHLVADIMDDALPR